ncbi:MULTISPECIES: type III secretion system protein PrgF [unclassified Enterococcus]|uniref:type III secretion system protein PrgF n=1 Tax=unclassified Enterococcus TaxID=2608891 RepID=UPI001CE22EB4|nr:MULTISPECIES: type III secretion system protein PrgF [unclassified Enterococcus]MCA5014556.1 type III secretion system protein PrgF [Enterococcus sp. S23]MCA5017809.1 type III secretion system protein PrgF [Enterococcus sp. S22(2020)]
MDIVSKIVTAIGAIITVVSLVGVLLGVKDVRSGMANDDPRKTDKGIEAIVVGGAITLIATGVAAAILVQLGTIKF